MNSKISSNKNFANNISNQVSNQENDRLFSTDCSNSLSSQKYLSATIDKSLYSVPDKSIYLSSGLNQTAFCGNFFSKIKFKRPFFSQSFSDLYNQLLKNNKDYSTESFLRFYKTILPDISDKDLNELSQNIDYIKNSEKLNIFDIYTGDADFNFTFVRGHVTKLNEALQSKGVKLINPAQYEQMVSMGKDVTKMSDLEIRQYYSSLIPFVNKKELNCLVDQIHRIQNNESRYLNTPEEREILRTLKAKQQFGFLLKGMFMRGGFVDVSKYPKSNIPFVKKELTDIQRAQLSGWTWSGAHPVRIEGLFEDLAITISNDTYLYRGISMNQNDKKVVDYFNNIKVGSIIDNSKRYMSAAQNVETTFAYSTAQSSGFNQHYFLKIKVPKGTKVIDNRISQGMSFDEVILPPNKLKVTSIDYNTGVVECEYVAI